MFDMLTGLLADAQADFQKAVLICVIVLVLMALWGVLALHRLARNQIEIARLLEQMLADSNQADQNDAPGSDGA